MKIHKLAKYFPILEGEEFDLFVQDIKKNGQLEPIVLYDDKILDGVNRWRACKELGIVPFTEEYTGDDPLSYIISLNIRRRHLDVSQRAMLATEMLPEFEKVAKEHMSKAGKGETVDTPLSGYDHGRATAEAGKQFGIDSRSVSRAKRIKEQAPDKVGDIIKGKTSVRAVDNELRQARADKVAKKRKDKDGDKTIKQHPKVVKEYLDATQVFKDAITISIEGAKREQFSPEAGRFVARRHEGIRQLMDELEELLK